MKRGIKISLLFIVILISILIAYQPHFDYKYPLVGDEYVHISFAKYILEENKLPFVNPYLSLAFPHNNFESGFHFFLAGVFSLIKADPVLYYKYFIIIFMIINSLLLFYLVMLLYKDYLTALFSVLFFGTIKSAGGFLAHQYFLPLTLGITLLFLALIFFYKLESLNSKKYILFLTITLLITALTYPPALFFFLGIIFFYVLFMENSFHKKFNLTKKMFLVYFSLISAVLIMLFALILKYLNLLDEIIFPLGWSAVQFNASPIFFFGVIPSVLAIIGLITIVYLKKSKIMIAWFLFSIIQIYLFYIFNTIYFIPFQRLFFFYLIGISILAGIGSSSIINNISKFTKIKQAKTYAIAFILVILAFHYFIVFSSPLQPINVLDDDKYNALKFLEKTYPEKSVVITDSITSLAVYPVSGNYVVGLIDSNIGGGDPEKANKFLTGNCEDKKQIMEQNFYKYLYKGNVSESFFLHKQKNLVLISNEKIEECDFIIAFYDKRPYLHDIWETYLTKK